MASDGIALTCAVLGGGFMGSYPVPLKAASVLEARVHPLIFQWYKSVMVLLAGVVLILFRVVQGSSPTYRFSWWAVASAGTWIPGGLCTIAAVPRIGVGMTAVISAGTASAMSFLVFWLVLGERIRQHGHPDRPVYFAPFYLIAVLVGMVGLVAVPRLRRVPEVSELMLCWGRSPTGKMGAGSHAHSEEHLSSTSEDVKDRLARPHTGLLLAFLAGAFSAAQFGTISVGRGLEMSATGCAGRLQDCPAELQERFNPFGSWMLSFGVGAVLHTGVYTGATALIEGLLWGSPPPALHTEVMLGPGTLAGGCWVLGACFQTAAAARGGNAVMMPVNYTMQLVTSSLWSILYYREIRNTQRALLWGFAAAWTLAAMVLLSGEQAEP